jgi:hypothetical protein
MLDNQPGQPRHHTIDRRPAITATVTSVLGLPGFPSARRGSKRGPKRGADAALGLWIAVCTGDAGQGESFDSPRGDEEAATDLLAQLARDGAALEFAIGTGRIALPLAQRGVPVDGVELSQSMVDVLRSKPGGAALDVTVGDMTSIHTGKRYEVVYLVYNTIFNLLTQDDQVRCFENPSRPRGADRGPVRRRRGRG